MSGEAVGPVGLFFLLFFGAAIPVRAYIARDRLTRMRPTRRRLYASTLVQLSVFLILAALTGRAEDVDLWRGPERWPQATVLALLFLVVMVRGARLAGRAAIERRDPKAYVMMPSGRGEASLWIALSLLAGVAEEVVYRGVFAELGVRLTGSTGLAWSAAVAAFAVAHANQGMKSMMAIAGYAVLAHLLVDYSGSLLHVVVLHAAFDAIVGFEYARLGRQLGYPMHGVPDAAGDVTAAQAASSP